MFAFRAITFMALICCLSIFSTACTISQPTTVTPVSQPHEGAAEQLKKSVTTEADGTIVSKDLVEVQDQNPKINIYRVTYMSGGVALRLASERQDIKAVIAVSPFVGWDEVIRWMDNNPNENSSYSVVSRRFDASCIKTFLRRIPPQKKKIHCLTVFLIFRHRCCFCKAPVMTV